MATFISSPKLQFFNTDGTPLAGGTLTVYASGTTTLSTIYSTIDDYNSSTNPITNPVTLDSRGECQIVLTESSKFLLKDALGNLLWTIDKIQNNTGDIFDVAGNELIKFTSVAGAINEITISNAASGNNPSIAATGDDTNIDLRLNAKGTGKVAILCGATVASGLDVTGNVTATGTLAVTGAVTGASFNTITGVATQVLQEAFTSNTVAVTPGTQKYHPTAAKAWGLFGVTGNLLAGFGISSITDIGTGQAGVNFSTSFSSTTYVVNVTTEVTGGSAAIVGGLASSARSVGTVNVISTIAGAPTDPTTYSVCCYGDQ